MKRHNHSDHQAIRGSDLDRMSTLGDKRLFDFVLHELLRVAGSSVKFVDGTSGFFSDGALEVVTGTGGNRATGWGMKIQAGLGFRKDSTATQPDADLPNFVPIYGATEQAFTTANSDGTLPRMDHVYIKPKYTAGDSATVKIIDPNPPNNITDESRDTTVAADYDFAYAVGTPDAGAAGGAGAPSPPSGYTSNDLISTILVLAGSGNIEDTEITDTRTLFEVHDQLLAGVTSLAASAINVSPTVLGQSDAQAALESIVTAIGATYPTGICIGRLEYIGPTSVKITPGIGGNIVVDVNGTVLSQAGDLTFDMTADHMGTEGASEAEYLYLQDVAGTMTEKIDNVAPVDGYHPTSTTYVCVGEVWNDDDQNLVPFVCSANGAIRLTEHKDDHEHPDTTIPDTAAATWTRVPVSIPEQCPEVYGWSHMREGNGGTVVYAADSASGTGLTGNDIMIAAMKECLLMMDAQGGANYDAVLQWTLPITNMTDPAIKIGCTDNVALHEMIITGWQSTHAPRWRA